MTDKNSITYTICKIAPAVFMYMSGFGFCRNVCDSEASTRRAPRSRPNHQRSRSSERCRSRSAANFEGTVVHAGVQRGPRRRLRAVHEVSENEQHARDHQRVGHLLPRVQEHHPAAALDDFARAAVHQSKALPRVHLDFFCML